MLKTLLITSLLTLFSSTAEAHNTCYLQTVWKPGHWSVAYHGTPYERSNWVDGYWIDKRVCPPPQPRPRPTITVNGRPIFPHVNIRYHSHPHRSHHRSHPHHSHHRR
jgi:hypothetical protein